MPAAVGFVVIDCTDPESLATFWCALLGVEGIRSFGGGRVVVLAPTGTGLTVGLQRVPEPKRGKNRMHLDLVVDDLDRATDEAVLGGRWLEPELTHELLGFRWRCMADPEGNEFDIETLPPS